VKIRDIKSYGRMRMEGSLPRSESREEEEGRGRGR